MDLMKTEEFEGLGLTAFDFPSAKINFSIEDDEYLHDIYYARNIKAKIKKLKEMSLSINKLQD